MKYIPVLQHYEWQRGVLDFADTPPENPAKGDAYIISEGTGIWTGKDNQIARYDGDDWFYILPFAGMFVRVASNQKLYVFNTDNWEEYTCFGGKYKQVLSAEVDEDTELNLLDGARITYFDLEVNGDVEITGVSFNEGKSPQDGDSLILRVKLFSGSITLSEGENAFKFSETITEEDISDLGVNSLNYIGCQWVDAFKMWVVLAISKSIIMLSSS